MIKLLLHYFSELLQIQVVRYRGINEEILFKLVNCYHMVLILNHLYTNLYLKEDLIYKLQGYVYLNFKRTENGVAYIHFTEKLN